MVFLVEGACFSLAIPGTDPDFHLIFFFFVSWDVNFHEY